jgi:hypothetical protein
MKHFSLCILLITFSLWDFGSNAQDIGQKLSGDFDGDGKPETAYIVQTKKGIGVPIETGITDEFEVRFDNPKIKAIKIDCCKPNLISEGDLFHNGKTAFSVYQWPEN